jgi:hypothetical protein
MHGIFRIGVGVAMVVLHCTKKLLERAKAPIVSEAPAPTTALGNWYATALFWKPQLALFVNERTLLPVFMPLAPVASIAKRFPLQLATVLTAHGIDAAFIEREVAAMTEVVFAKTASRSMLGMMNEFTFSAEASMAHRESRDLVGLSLRLADMIFTPIKYSSPAEVLNKLVRQQDA